MDKITIKYGGKKLSLTKSKSLIGIKPNRNTSRRSNHMRRNIQEMDTGMHLARFNVLDVSARDEDMESMLDQLRVSPDIQSGSHVYHTSDDGVAFMPSGQIYLEFKEKTTTTQCQKLIEKHHLQIVKSYSKKELVVRISKSSDNPLKVAAALQKNKSVKVAEPDLSTPGKLWSYIPPADQLLDRQWHLENTGFHRGTSIGLKRGADARVVKAWNRIESLGSSSVVVAVIDDGFDLNHPDLNEPGKIIAPWDFTRNTPNPAPEYRTGYPYYDREYQQFIGDWHGTACAGVAVGSANGIGILGAAPNCRLMPIRWGTGLSDESIENWFDYVRLQGAGVLSCSWGAAARVFRLSTRMKNAIKRCALEGRNNKGTVICFAAGNSDRDIDAPDGSSHDGFATHPNVVAVSAINSRDRKSHYSNFGDNISVCAPSSGAGGMGITTSDVTGSFQYYGYQIDAGYNAGDFTDEFGGTSSACPLVAGVCALILSIDPCMHANDVKNLIQQTARKVGRQSDYDANGHSPIYGYGCVDAEKAIECLMNNNVA